jgi:hypothetical protein
LHLRGLQLTVDIYEGTFESTKVLSKVLSYESTKVRCTFESMYFRTLLFISYESTCRPTFEGTKVPSKVANKVAS